MGSKTFEIVVLHCKGFQMLSVTMHFSYTNHVVVQNIYISTSRRRGQLERTEGANHERENNTSRPAGKHNKLFVKKVSFVSPPFVNKTPHLRCKHQYRVDRVRERTENDGLWREGPSWSPDNREVHSWQRLREVTASHSSFTKQHFLFVLVTESVEKADLQLATRFKMEAN